MKEFIKKHHFTITLSCILLFGFLLRLWRLESESIWIDEAYSIQLARYPLAQIIQGTAADQHPPLYYFLLHLWLFLGDSIWNFRFLSVILGTLNIWQVVQLGTKIRDEKFGLVAGVLLAVMPLHVYYSQEVRMYMLLLVNLTASTTMLWDWLQDRKVSQWFLYIVFNLAALYTHNFSAFVILTQALFILIISVLHRDRKIFLQWFLSMSICLVGYLPWLPVALNQMRYHTMDWLGSPSPEMIRDTFLRLVFGFPWPSMPSVLDWAVITLIVVILVGFSVFYFKKKRNLEVFSFVFLWALIPFVTISIISEFYPIFQIKQFIIILPALAFTYALIAGNLPKWFRRGLILGILAVFLVTSIGQSVILTKDDWRGTSKYLQNNFLEGDLIYANPSASFLAINLYAPNIPVDSYSGYPPDYQILTGGWKEGTIVTFSKAQEVLKPYLSHRRIWLVEFTPQLWDPEGLIPFQLAQNYNQVLDQDFTRIRLRLFTEK